MTTYGLAADIAYAAMQASKGNGAEHVSNGSYHGPEWLDVGKPRHLTSDEVFDQVSLRMGEREIDDAAAVTIASWWQSPGTEGYAFAQLASTGRVGLEALADDLHIAFAQATNPGDRRALDMFGTWMLNHPSRHIPQD